MVTRIPKRLDLAKAIAGYAWEGELPLSEFPRLLGLLSGPEPKGTVSFRVDFSSAKLLPGQARVQVKTTLPLQCQRSLEDFDLPVDIDRQVGFVETTGQLDRLAPDMEPSWLHEGQVSIRDLVEDELILAVPEIPLSEQGEVPTQYLAEAHDTPGDVDSSGTSPFSVLQQLKGE